MLKNISMCDTMYYVKISERIGKSPWHLRLLMIASVAALAHPSAPLRLSPRVTASTRSTLILASIAETVLRFAPLAHL